jgi:hypothetical protein
VVVSTKFHGPVLGARQPRVKPLSATTKTNSNLKGKPSALPGDSRGFAVAAGKPFLQKNRGCNFKSIHMQMVFNGLKQGVKREEKGKRSRFDFGDRLRIIPVASARGCNTVSYEGIEARTQAETPLQLLRFSPHLKHICQRLAMNKIT